MPWLFLPSYPPYTPTPHPPQIRDCDDILVQMEGMLGRFQSDLGNISSEIRALQEQSSSMSVRLKNRRTVQVGLPAAPAYQSAISSRAKRHCGVSEAEQGRSVYCSTTCRLRGHTCHRFSPVGPLPAPPQLSTWLRVPLPTPVLT